MLPPHERTLFAEALRAVWDGYNEIDGFNQLVLAAGLTWRQATVLRAYAKYLKQGNSPFALDYIEEALRSNVDITRLLVEPSSRASTRAAATGRWRPTPRRASPRSRRSSTGWRRPSTTWSASTTTAS